MRIAFITSRFPYPIEKGDKLRAFHHLEYLGSEHEVHLVALNHGPVPEEYIRELEKHCASVQVFELKKWKTPFNVLKAVFAGLPMQVGYFLDSGVRRQVMDHLIRLQPDLVFSQLIRTAQYVRGLPMTKVLDYMDTFSVGAQQRGLKGNWLLRPAFLLESNLVRQYERVIYADFDYHTIISKQDRDRLALPYPRSVHVIPNGVDVDYFSPMETQQKWTVVFVGNMGYAPNVEAAEYLVRKIMPIVWQSMPEATVCLAGARPAPSVKALAGKRVTVTGWIEDVRPYYAGASVFVAPMQSGMGLQNKILEAMAIGTPCITTPIVNNAIRAEVGKEIMVGANARSISDLILYAAKDAKLRSDLSKAGRNFVEREFSWKKQNHDLKELLQNEREYFTDYRFAGEQGR